MHSSLFQSTAIERCCVMMNWRSVSALLILGSLAACATATSGDAFSQPAGGSDSGGSGPFASAGALVQAGANAANGGSITGGAASGGVVNSGGSSLGGAVGHAGAAGTHTGGQSGTSSGGAGGGANHAGSGGAGGASGASNSGPCAAPKDVSGGKSDNLGTTGAVCLRTSETFNTIGCSNWGGRTIKVNGVVAPCVGVKATFAPAIDGYNYFEVSAGDVDFAAFVWYTS